MKSKTYITEITTLREENYVDTKWGGKQSSGSCLLANSPGLFVSTKKISLWVYWKVFCHFWPISESYFWGDFPLSFLLLYDFMILLKSRGGGTFLCLVLSVNIRQKKFFLKLKTEYPVFCFLDLDGTILNLI